MLTINKSQTLSAFIVCLSGWHAVWAKDFITVKRCKAEVGQEMTTIFQTGGKKGAGHIALVATETTHLYQ